MHSCPNCGADLPKNAVVCPECGSDEKTGWSDEAAASGLGAVANARAASTPAPGSRTIEQLVRSEMAARGIGYIRGILEAQA